MSPNTNPVACEYNVAPTECLPEGLPETAPVEQPVEQPAPCNKKEKKSSKFLCRLCGLILVVLCAVPFLLKVPYVTGKTVQSATLIGILGELFGEGAGKLIVLPVLGWTGNALGKITAMGIYTLLGGAVIGIVTGLLAAIFAKKGALRVSAFFATAMYSVYALSVMMISKKPEIILLALALVGAIIYALIAFKTRCCKKAVWKAGFNAIFCAFVAVGLVMAPIYYIYYFDDGLAALKLSALGKILKVLMVIVAATYITLGAIRVQTKKGGKFQFVMSIITLVLSVLALIIGLLGKASETNWYLIATAAAIVISLAQFLLGLKKYRVKKEKPAKEEPQTFAPVEEYVREEYAEAVNYEGGPVEGVALAEEVVPSFSPDEPSNITTTEGYNFLNCKSFDPFMASLNEEERFEFTELFIMRIKCLMPEIPQYVVGSEDYNKEFFRKWFIYLGQYRDRISDNLLAKIYRFSIKIQ